MSPLSPWKRYFRRGVSGPTTNTFLRGPEVPPSRLPSPAPPASPRLPCPAPGRADREGVAASPFVVRRRAGGFAGTGDGERTGHHRDPGGGGGRSGAAHRVLRGWWWWGEHPAGRGEGGPPGAGRGRRSWSLGWGTGRAWSAGIAAKGSGLAAWLRRRRSSPPPPSLCPPAGGRAAVRAGPAWAAAAVEGTWLGPAPRPRMRGAGRAAGRTMQLHVSLAARFKEKRAGGPVRRGACRRSLPPLARVPPHPLPAGSPRPG